MLTPVVAEFLDSLRQRFLSRLLSNAFQDTVQTVAVLIELLTGTAHQGVAGVRRLSLPQIHQSCVVFMQETAIHSAVRDHLVAMANLAALVLTRSVAAQSR